MRTTLSLDDDVLAVAKVLARQQRQPIGSVISALVRQALTTPQPGPSDTPAACSRNGLPLLPLRLDGGPADLTLVNGLRDEFAP
jgi:hypothetical protein